MNTKLLIVPQLRFHEFSDEWQTSQLSNVAQISSGGTPTRTNPSYWNGAIPWVTTSEINFNTITDVKQHITDQGMKKSAAKLFPKNSLLMALYGQGKTRGKVAILGLEATTNQACAAIIPNNTKLDYLFLFQNLSARYDELRKLSNGGSQKNLSGQLIKSLNLTIPSKREQQKIADYLRLVDDRIRLIDKKVELMKQYKKSVMQKIFTQEICFKDEDGNDYPDWEEKELGKFLSLSNKERIKDIDRGKILTVKLHRKGVMPSTNTESLKIGSTTYYRRYAGELIYGKQNLFNGAIAIVPVQLDGYLSSGDVPSLKLNNGIISPDYLLAYIGRKSYYKKLEAVASGSGSKRIHEKVFLEQVIELPSLEEQEKISGFLDSIDLYIKAEVNKLTNTKKFKQVLLQRMFV